MMIDRERFIAEAFFFILLFVGGYLMWEILLPFLGALALSAIVVTICYPLHTYFKNRFPKLHPGLLSMLSVSVVFVVVIIPVVLLSYLVLGEAVAIYGLFNNSQHNASVTTTVTQFEHFAQQFIPGFSVDMAKIAQQTASFFVEHLVVLFAGTASTIFLFFIALIGMYYFFKDGDYFTQYLIRLSPLNDTEDRKILDRLALSVRSVALGSVGVALLQGLLTSIGLTLVGFDRAILWGAIAAIGALVPGVGTTIVIVPSVLYLIVTGNQLPAFFLALWGMIAVGLIDNLIGPHLMSRKNRLHPFLILISVLGGIAKFGPLGFILGPVILSFFLVVVELYHARSKYPHEVG